MVRNVDAATLYRWRDRLKPSGAAGLGGAYGNRKGRGFIDSNEALPDVILGALLNQPHITPKEVRQYLAAAHPELNIVSVKSIDHFIKRYKADHLQGFMHATNPDAWKSKFQLLCGSQHANIKRLNQVWEMDSTPGDWLLTDGRHMVLGVVDLYPRRLKFLVSKTSRAAAVCSLYRRAVLDWEVNEVTRTDNGADYVSGQFTLVLRELTVEHELCNPFASEQKGTIERHLQIMSDDLLDLLPEFIGHSVAERKVIEARKSFAQRVMTPGEVVEVALTAAELQAKLDQWADHIYINDAHSGQGMDGQTPFERALRWTEPVRRIADEHALDVLLLAIAGTRTLTKKGLRLDNYRYIHEALCLHTGYEVFLRRDAADMGRLYVWAAETGDSYAAGEFICTAECPELTGTCRRRWRSPPGACCARSMNSRPRRSGNTSTR